MPHLPAPAILGYDFTRPELLRQALTHRSCGVHNNERLEFLGDSVLNCVVAEQLYQRYPKLSEGDLSRLRAHLVREPTLADIAQTLRLGDSLMLGEGEMKSGGFRRPSILADALEAIIGAVFLDGGFQAAQKVVHGLYAGLLETLDPRVIGKDPKTLLQELLQGKRIGLPKYTVTAITGEAHEQHFSVECVIADLGIRTLGAGHSKRSAEQEAARAAHEEVLNA